MTEPAHVQPTSPNGDGRILPLKMRLYLYAAAGIIFALWLSLELLGSAGFVAFVVAMALAQLTFRLRPSLNAAFVAGLIGYALTIAVWTATVGPPSPTNTHATQTAAAAPDR